MYLIQNITNNPLQTMNLILPNGNPVQMTIYFIPLQVGWFITNLNYQSFTIQGIRIVNSPNMLQQFRNQIPFGLGCYSTQNREPTQNSDFSSGANQLFLLNSTEVESVTEFLQNGR